LRGESGAHQGSWQDGSRSEYRWSSSQHPSLEGHPVSWQSSQSPPPECQCTPPHLQLPDPASWMRKSGVNYLERQTKEQLLLVLYFNEALFYYIISIDAHLYACKQCLYLALLYSLSLSIWMWWVFRRSFWFSTMSRGRQIRPASV